MNDHKSNSKDKMSLARLALALVAGFLIGWYYAIFIYSPTKTDFLEVTTSNYFKQLSEHFKHTKHALGLEFSYWDCEVVGPTENHDKNLGVAAIGICGSSSENENYHYFVALSKMANILYSDFDVRKK